MPLVKVVVNRTVTFIRNSISVGYSDTNYIHWELLCSIYKHIIDTGRSAVPRFGSHWEKIGFQGEDPASDLRGVGIFGLCQLLFLVSNGLSSQMTSQLHELSNDKVQVKFNIFLISKKYFLALSFGCCWLKFYTIHSRTGQIRKT